METTAVTTTQTAIAPAAAESQGTNISSDFETFLKMLTVQMQNQDPLNPIDSADYAVQLATFSGVEQQVQTNDLLKSLAASLGAAGLSDMAGWVGMEARSVTPAYFAGTPLTVVPVVEPTSDAAKLVITDENGNDVQRIDVGASGEPVIWAGVSDNGTPFPAGTYTISTASYAAGRPTGVNAAEVYQPVSEVQFDGTQSIVVLEGGARVNATDVTALRDPSAS